MFFCFLIAWLENPHKVNELMSVWRPQYVLTISLTAALPTRRCWYLASEEEVRIVNQKDRGHESAVLFLIRDQVIVDTRF